MLHTIHDYSFSPYPFKKLQFGQNHLFSIFWDTTWLPNWCNACIAACYVVISILKMTCATFKTPRLFEYLSRVCSYLLKCACYATKSFKMCSYSCGCSCFNHILLNQQTLAIGITPLIFLAFKRQVIYHFSHISCLSRSVYLGGNGFCEYKVSITYDNKAK